MIVMKQTRVRSILVVIIVLAGMAMGLTGCGVARDTQLQTTIKEELRKDPNVQVDKLIVNVRDGVVSISGELYTREEIDRVVEIVTAVEGVITVRNHMTLPDNYNSSNPTFLDPFN